jgi:hypothetical protein
MKDQLIADLVANERCPLTAEELEGFEPERLQQLAEAFIENEDVTDEGDETPTDDTPTGDDEPTISDVMARFDSIDERMGAVEGQLSANAEREKTELVDILVANERCPLDQDALKKLGVPELQALAQSYAPADYSGRGGLRTQQITGDLVEAPMPEAE